MRYNGITHNEEILLRGYYSKGITQTGDIIKELNKIGISRSQAFIIKHLKRLGIYQYPNMDLVIHNRDKVQREQRIKIAEDRGFSVLNNESRKKSKVKCNICNTILNYSTMVTMGCNQCKTKQRIEQRKQNDFEIRDKINSAKNKEYISRVKRLKEFIHKELYKEYTNWKETPVCNEYKWYRGKNSKGYKNNELDYKIDTINYYHYKTNKTLCPDKTTKGYRICNHCGISKPIRKFNRNTCKPCAKEYRRIHILPNELKRTKEKYKSNPVFKLDSIIRTYIYGALKGIQKSKRTKDILGISADQFREYIEQRFESWMSWDTHGVGEGKWQLQHIVPREFATNENEIYLLNHYQNFIPMCATANGVLKNRIIEEQMNEWHNTDKGIQKIIKRNKDRVISQSEFKKMLPVIVREIDTNKIKQSEQKLTKWFVY